MSRRYVGEKHIGSNEKWQTNQKEQKDKTDLKAKKIA